MGPISLDKFTVSDDDRLLLAIGTTSSSRADTRILSMFFLIFISEASSHDCHGSLSSRDETLSIVRPYVSKIPALLIQITSNNQLASCQFVYTV
jgi:hypothetical protein